MTPRRLRRPAPPREAVTALVEGFAHDGRGVARIDGKPVFIDGGLPGEAVRFRYTDIRRDYAEGRVEAVLSPSADRVAPRCPHFGTCGGCSLQHLAPEAQIQAKQQLLLDQFQRIGKLAEVELLPPLTGPVWAYRHKARLGVKNVPKKGRVLVGFRERSSAFIAELGECPVLHPKLGEHLLDLADLIGVLSIRDRLPQIEVAVGDTRAALVFRVLDDPTPADLARLRGFAEEHQLDVYLQRGGPDSVAPLYPESPPLLAYRLPAQDIECRFHPTEFTQVNVAINRAMVDRVLTLLAPAEDERILDLYAGIGNFTLPIARKARHVVGVEGNPAAVKRARENAMVNGIGNAEFHIADLTRPLAGIPWAEQRYHKLLLDPSRAGASEVLSQLPRWAPARIVYVSCNPSTLARDAGSLVHDHGYRLRCAGVMDMFPHTAHVESIAVFER